MSPRPTVKAAHPPLGTPVRYPRSGTPLVRRNGAEYDPAYAGTLTGARLEHAATVRQLVETAGDKIREGLADDDTVRDYIATVKLGVKLGKRTEMRLYSEVMKLLGEERKLVVEFVNSLGAQSETELRRIVDAYKSAGEADSLTALERMTTAMEALLPLHEEHRAMIVRRLGGFMPSHTEGEVLG